jgi:hypothetical protein
MNEQLPMFTDVLQPGEYVLPDGETTACASCGAAIIWTRTPGGRAIPLSMATKRQCGEKWMAMTHFTDCPHRREWRRT